MQQKIIVMALAKSGNKVLLLNREQKEFYELPSVFLMAGDNPTISLQNILAELFDEEDVCDICLSDVVSNIDSAKTEQRIIIVYTVRMTEGEPTCHESGGRWVELSKGQPSEIENLSLKVLQSKTVMLKTGVNTKGALSVDVKLTTSEHVLISTDGGSRGNPGPSASAFVILNDKEEVIYEGGKYIGITTNNQAEYQAVKLALEKALELGARSTDFKMDSLLIVNQMSGFYQIKNRDLWPIYANIKELMNKFSKVTFSHVGREFNKEADMLVNKILNEHSE